ncbi:hypothetical protein SARC_12373 [Sphaeroforma arctica JP610]|uniref:Uncharacterized protein n=1 Tax=Sphaeroforma arctica JP610 TaxID=667725 RepID=A0A0L0FF69_9EUKA|nr:hypothetical protein SARC_12373 [Sphaeroforma arctica JP610]KNC75096.1 hypothetical protein SARC_12373 [Sphaeroforma arctica JP610]|eukprot:XP_014148998.1 hypothetical protein SARC_12373 [Sphaeroforma arctica JP610]
MSGVVELDPDPEVRRERRRIARENRKREREALSIDMNSSSVDRDGVQKRRSDEISGQDDKVVATLVSQHSDVVGMHFGDECDKSVQVTDTDILAFKYTKGKVCDTVTVSTTMSDAEQSIADEANDGRVQEATVTTNSYGGSHTHSDTSDDYETASESIFDDEVSAGSLVHGTRDSTTTSPGASTTDTDNGEAAVHESANDNNPSDMFVTPCSGISIAADKEGGVPETTESMAMEVDSESLLVQGTDAIVHTDHGNVTKPGSEPLEEPVNSSSQSLDTQSSCTPQERSIEESDMDVPKEIESNGTATAEQSGLVVLTSESSVQTSKMVLVDLAGVLKARRTAQGVPEDKEVVDEESMEVRSIRDQSVLEQIRRV